MLAPLDDHELAGQDVHVPAPDLLEKNPCEQTTHVALEVAPVPAEEVPAAQV